MTKDEIHFKVIAFIVEENSKLAGAIPETIVKNKHRLTDLAIDWTSEFTNLYKDEVWSVSLFDVRDVLEPWLRAKLYREDGYTITDPDTQQRVLYKGLGKFHFVENRNGEEYERVLNWMDFDDTDFQEAGKAFGYDRNQVLDAYNNYEYDDVILMLEWVFELNAEPWNKTKIT